MQPVRKAVFPVAGLGTRFLPATKAMPKEMLPIVDKPLIQYAVEEASAAGITQMIFITGRHKRSIEDHFDRAPELEAELAAKGKTELLDIVRNISPAAESFVYIRQAEPLGLGHAVLCAESVVGDEPFAVILADDLIDAGRTVIGQLCDARAALGGGSVLAVEDVPRAETARYGIVSSSAIDARTSRLSHIVEKPAPERGAVDSGGGWPLCPRTRDFRAAEAHPPRCRRRNPADGCDRPPRAGRQYVRVSLRRPSLRLRLEGGFSRGHRALRAQGRLRDLTPACSAVAFVVLCNDRAGAQAIEPERHEEQAEVDRADHQVRPEDPAIGHAGSPHRGA